ncbi:MAG: DNA cytosine methyltransferase [Thermodesulfobacteriota bacterium]
MLRVLDLFSGIIGFSVGFENVGMKTIAFCENDPDCRDQIRDKRPGVPIIIDVKSISYINGVSKWETGKDDESKACLDFGKVDVICGGFPCQDISVAGNKVGFESEEEVLSGFKREFIGCYDETGKQRPGYGGTLRSLCEKIRKAGEETKTRTTRSGLWKEFIRVVEEIKPRHVIVENVANLRNQGLNKIIEDLWKVGYVGQAHILPARAFGAPHLRERIFIVAHSTSKRNERHRITSRAQQKKSKFVDNGSSRDATNTNSIGIRDEPRGRSGKDGESSQIIGQTSNGRGAISTDRDHVRLWEPFATKEEKSEWWTEATTGLCHWSKVEPPIPGVDDGLPKGLDIDKKRSGIAKRLQKRIKELRIQINGIRKKRIKQLGNSILPVIAEFIGRKIIEKEKEWL